MSGNINTKNITSENITVTNLTVTNINGRPYNGCTSYNDCNGNFDPCDGIRGCEDLDPCDCVSNPCIGPQGATGRQGVTGAQGRTGAQGSTGSTGAQGSIGSIGVTGAQGVTGRQGVTGAQGVTGSQGDIGPQGSVGPSSTYYLDYQIVPLLPLNYTPVLESLYLYYSYAITTNSCINVVPPPEFEPCGKNNYEYNLYECLTDERCPNFIASHKNGEICKSHEGLKLGFCSNARYMCAIVGGPDGPREDAYIEWHWYAKYTDTDTGTPVTTTGKFIFVASATYIQNQYTQNGYSGNGAGIGMFNPSNHNP